MFSASSVLEQSCRKPTCTRSLPQHHSFRIRSYFFFFVTRYENYFVRRRFFRVVHRHDFGLKIVFVITFIERKRRRVTDPWGLVDIEFFYTRCRFKKKRIKTRSKDFDPVDGYVVVIDRKTKYVPK